MASSYYERHRELLKARARARYYAKREKIRAQQAEYRKTPAGKTAMRELNLRRFGLSVAKYDTLLASQSGGCAICGATDSGVVGRRLAVDHDHRSGVVRGLLCQGCNTGIGNLKENPEFLEKAAAYLRRAEGA